MKLPETKLDITPSTRRGELLTAIAEEEARLAKLEADQVASRGRLEAHRSELAEYGVEPLAHVRIRPVAGRSAPTTPAEKVSVSRSLFRGREDVFPTRFVSKKTSKPDPTDDCPHETVTLNEAASLLGVCAMTVRRLIGRGILPAVQAAPTVPWSIRRSALHEPRVQAAVQASKDYRSRTTRRYPKTLEIPGM